MFRVNTSRQQLIRRETKSHRTFRALTLMLAIGTVTASCNLGNPDTPDTASVTQLSSPIDEYLHLVFGTNLSPEALIRQRELENQRQEDLIAECMAAQGFQYTPDPENTMFTWDDADADWHPNDPDWLHQYGFGGIIFPPGSPTGGLHTTSGAVGRRDPNQEHRMSLTPAEGAAWNIALNGDRSNFAYMDEDERNTFLSDLNNFGCFGWAVLEVRNETPAGLPFDAEFAPLFDAIDQFRVSLATTATQADRDWAICMNDAGYGPFNYRPDFLQLFSAEHFDVSNEIRDRLEHLGHFPFTPEDAPEVAAIFDREVATALADLECRNEVDFNARRSADVIELEAQFVTDHRVEFDALRSAIEQRTWD